MTTKQIITTIMLCVCSFSGIQAQSIQNGSKWWDGGGN